MQLFTMIKSTSKRPTSESQYEWVWPDESLHRTEFRGIADVVLRELADPTDLAPIYRRFPNHNPTDNVVTGERWPLSQHAIYALARALGPVNYLEVGTRLGYSIGAVLAASRRLNHAVTVDPFVDAGKIQQNLQSVGRSDVKTDVVIQMSRDFDTDERFDLVYVDGDHSYEVAFGDLKQYWQYVRPGGLMLVDDTINERTGGMMPREKLGVYWAVKDMLQTTRDVAAAVVKLPTYSGFAVIQKQG
jgi:predicted O-methyltransferase YrrM